MAATVSSPWTKPGAWALAAEQQEAEDELEQQAKAEFPAPSPAPAAAAAEFPSLRAAATGKPKKKKGQTLSLAAFNMGETKPAAQTEGLTLQDRLSLPTGPRERTAEELDRNRLGGGFRNYGSDRGGGRYSNGEDSSESKWGSGQRREGGGFGKESSRDGPSRADEIDDWGAAKKSTLGGGFDRRERGAGGSFFGGSQSKADESDSWVSNKSSLASEGRRFGGSGGGFDRERKVGFASNGGGADSDNWGRRKEESNGGSGFDRERKVGFVSNDGGADSDVWGKKREESNGSVGESAGRPRLNLQPRTLPVSIESPPTPVEVTESKPVIVARPKGANPFGEARPREEVLAEKGKDWKKIDEELESVKIKEVAERVGSPAFGKRSFGIGNGRAGDRTEGAWRRPDVADARPQSAEKNEIRSSSEEPDSEEPISEEPNSEEQENGHVDGN